MNRSCVKSLSICLAVMMMIIAMVPRVEAGFSPTVLKDSSDDREGSLLQVRKVLEMKMVKERLESLGFTERDIQSRLTEMSDDQLHNLALSLDEIQVGGDSGLGIIIGLLIIVILVVVLLQLTGHKVIVR
jgi:hypothetical protein